MPARLTLEVSLMDDPCLWRWDIKDPIRDAIVESSWEQLWTGYASREEAYRAGRERLRLVTQHGLSSEFGRWRFGAA
jgi:hypothetical protein